MRRGLRTAGLGAAALAASGAAVVMWAHFIERVRFTLQREEIALLEPGTPPLRILHLSDFHLAPWQTLKRDFVQSLAAEAPDLLIATGDNLGHRDAIPALREMLAPFAGIPALSVFGSNDYYGPVVKNPLTYLFPPKTPRHRARDLDEGALRELLFGELGWTDLTNTATIIEAGAHRIRAFGVDDPHIGVDRLEQTREAFAAVSADGRWDLTLGLVHAPYRRILDAYVRDFAADAVFAGHTHGGQVCLPGGRALVANCDLPLDQAGGLSTWESGGRTAQLQVSRGLGTSITAPVRTFCPPEATLMTLVAR